MEIKSETNTFAGHHVDQQEEVFAVDNDGITEHNNRQQHISQRLQTDQNIRSNTSTNNSSNDTTTDLNMDTLDNTCDELNKLSSAKYSYADSDEDSLDFDANAIDIPTIDENDFKLPLNERIFNSMPHTPVTLANRSPLLKVHNVTYKFNFDPLDVYSRQTEYQSEPSRLELPSPTVRKKSSSTYGISSPMNITEKP